MHETSRARFSSFALNSRMFPSLFFFYFFFVLVSFSYFFFYRFEREQSLPFDVFRAITVRLRVKWSSCIAEFYALKLTNRFHDQVKVKLAKVNEFNENPDVTRTSENCDTCLALKSAFLPKKEKRN